MSTPSLLAQLSLGGPTAVPAYVTIGEIIANGDLASGNMATLAASINAVPHEPSFLGSRGVFNYVGSRSRTNYIEKDGQVINVIQSTQPGTSPQSAELTDRVVKPFLAPQIKRKVTVLASEVNAYRALGSTQLASVEDHVDRKLRNAIRDIRATLEWHRVGAVKGQVLDADATTVISDMFATFGLSQSVYDVTFGTTATSKFIGIAEDIKNLLEDQLQGLQADGGLPLVICGRTFFKRFTTDPSVVNAYQYFQSTRPQWNPVRTDVRYEDFEHGGIVWRQYRGTASNTGRFVADTEAYLIPDGDIGMFLGYFCPPDDILDQVNTLGMPLYPVVETMAFKKGYEIEIQCNPLHVNTRPTASIKLMSSN